MRSEHNRLRVGRIQVDIYLGGAATELKQLERAATDCRVCGATEKPAMYGFTTPLTDLSFDQALQAEPNIGLLLPCNVIVREEALGRVVVGFLDPQTMVGLVGKTAIQLVADQAEKRLRRACASLGGSAAG